MVLGWLELFYDAISSCVSCLMEWKILDVSVAGIIIAVSVFIVVFRGFLYRIKG